MTKPNFLVYLFFFLGSSPVFADASGTLITVFWNTVAENETKYFHSELSTPEDWEILRLSIKNIDTGLDALIMSEIIGGKNRLIITTGCRKELFGLAEKIVSMAPSLKLLSPVALFPRLTEFEPFTVDGIALSVGDVAVRFDDPEDGMYDLIYVLPEEHIAKVTYDETDEYYTAYMNVLYLMTMQVLGERLMAEKINGIDMFRVNVFMPGIPLSKLCERIK
ncbi:MAG: hypothetical protein JW881_21040 [Spirochaetales bacterium]|nr:hypothetical protein [Spirochaetales bacterium]